jgi:hypothetical protein
LTCLTTTAISEGLLGNLTIAADACESPASKHELVDPYPAVHGAVSPSRNQTLIQLPFSASIGRKLTDCSRDQII